MGKHQPYTHTEFVDAIKADRDRKADLARQLYEALKEEPTPGKHTRAWEVVEGKRVRRRLAALARYEQEVGDG